MIIYVYIFLVRSPLFQLFLTYKTHCLSVYSPLVWFNNTLLSQSLSFFFLAPCLSWEVCGAFVMFQTEQMKDLVLSACAAAEGGRISSFLGDLVLVPLKMDVASFFPSLEGFQTWSKRHHHLNCWWLLGVWIMFGSFTANYVGQFQKRRALKTCLESHIHAEVSSASSLGLKCHGPFG